MGESLRERLQSLVGHLAVRIGPRGSASEQEAQAAHFVAAQLRQAGFQVEIQGFLGPTSFSWAYLLIYSTFCLAAAAALVSPTLGFGLAVLAALAMVGENQARETVSQLLPKRPSRNVVARQGSLGLPTQRVILTCHLDSARSAILWHPKLVAGFENSFRLMLAAMAGLVLLTANPSPTNGWRAAVIGLGLYLFSSVLVMIHREFCMPLVAGANDNASGVAAAVAAAERCRLEETELWVVATGCEESGLVGMLRFLDSYRADLPTIFVNLDNCGSGTPTVTRSEGMLRPYRCDPLLVQKATLAGLAPRPFHTMHTDLFCALTRGYRGISVMAFDQRGVLPNWHWKTDTVENIDFDCLERVTRALLEVLKSD